MISHTDVKSIASMLAFSINLSAQYYSPSAPPTAPPTLRQAAEGKAEEGRKKQVTICFLVL